MEAFAWTGVGIAAMLLAAASLSGMVGMLTSPIGRALLIAWSLIGVAAWALVGTIYLLVQAVQ